MILIICLYDRGLWQGRSVNRFDVFLKKREGECTVKQSLPRTIQYDFSRNKFEFSSYIRLKSGVRQHAAVVNNTGRERKVRVNLKT